MQIEAGKYYRAENGVKGFAISIELPNPFLNATDDRPVHVVFADGVRYYTAMDGSIVIHGKRQSHSLIEPWVDPPTCEEVLRELVAYVTQYVATEELRRISKRADAALATLNKEQPK